MRKWVLSGEATYHSWGWPPGSCLHTTGLEANPHLPVGQVETCPGWDSSSISEGKIPQNIVNCLTVWKYLPGHPEYFYLFFRPKNYHIETAGECKRDDFSSKANYRQCSANTPKNACVDSQHSFGSALIWSALIFCLPELSSYTLGGADTPSMELRLTLQEGQEEGAGQDFLPPLQAKGASHLLYKLPQWRREALASQHITFTGELSCAGRSSYHIPACWGAI